jgi:hypothetical protein
LIHEIFDLIGQEFPTTHMQLICVGLGPSSFGHQWAKIPISDQFPNTDFVADMV